MGTRTLIDIDTAATMLADTPRHIRRLIHERKIPHIKVGHFVRFDVAELDAWLEANRREVVA